MDEKWKKFFLLGLGVAAAATAAGIAYANRKKIKKAIDGLVKEGKIKADEGEKLFNELMAHVKAEEKKILKKVKPKPKAKKAKK